MHTKPSVDSLRILGHHSLNDTVSHPKGHESSTILLKNCVISRTLEVNGL